MNGNNIQDSYLSELMQNKTAVSLYLINGIKLSGTIFEVDDSCILLRDNKSTVTQLIYKHAVSTIVPVKNEPKAQSELID
jgi:host factor-I protein